MREAIPSKRIFQQAHFFTPEELVAQIQSASSRKRSTIWARISALLNASELPKRFNEPRPFFKKAHFWTVETLVYQAGRTLFPMKRTSQARKAQRTLVALLQKIIPNQN